MTGGRRRAKVPGIGRVSVDHQPRPVPDADLESMHRIDKLPMEFPVAPPGHRCAVPCRPMGSQMLQGLPIREGLEMGRLHIATLPFVTFLRNALPRQRMKRMGVEALHCQAEHVETGAGARNPSVSAAKAGHRPANQVWAMDIPDIPISRRFIYLAAAPDWFTRRVLAWRASIAPGRLLHRSCRGRLGAP